MQEKQTLVDRLILAVAVLLGAGVVIFAFMFAINPDFFTSSKVPLEDFKLDNYRGSTSLDDEKTSGTTNQVIPVWKRRNAVEVPAQDLMDFEISPATSPTGPLLTDDPSKYTTGETIQMSTVAPIDTPTR